MNNEFKEIPIKKIEVIENSRVETKEDDLLELMQSIKQHGLQQPIGVYKNNDNYVLIWGYRRLLACKKLGYDSIIASVKKENVEFKELLIKNTIENTIRKDITPVEMGRIIHQLHEDYGLSFDEISIKLSVVKTRILNCYNVYNKLPSDYENVVKFGKQGMQKKDGLQISTVSIILNHAKFFCLPEEEVKEILFFVKKNAFSKDQINVLLKIMYFTGKKIEDCQKYLKEFQIFCPKLILNVDDIKKHMKIHNKNSLQSLIMQILLGKIPALPFNDFYEQILNSKKPRKGRSKNGFVNE